MPALPFELWIHIADYIPPYDLPRFAGVNRLFFEAIMDQLYNQLSFISSDTRVFTEKVQALNSTSLAERVRVLTLWPGAIRDAIGGKGGEDSSDDEGSTRNRSPSPKFKHARYLMRGREYVGELLGHRRSPSVPSSRAGVKSSGSAHERRQMFFDAIRNLTRVEEMRIDWYYDKGVGGDAWTFAFFPEIWKHIGQNLQRLSIDIQVYKMNDAVKYCGSLPNLEELTLVLRCDNARGHPGDTIVPYFINNHASTLRRLSLKTIGHQDLSLIFQLLGILPHLTHLSIGMPLDARHLPDPSGFNQFLQNHPKLQNFSIRYIRCCTDCAYDGFSTFDGKHKLFRNITLPAMHTLELGLHIPMAVGATDPLYYSIARLGTSLTSLTLKDRSLKLDEVKAILRLFPSYRLKRLSLFAQLLTPQLIDHIAKVCPALNSLSLDVETIVKSEDATDRRNNDVDGFSEALANYAVDLDNDRWRYRTWLLSDISIMHWEFKVGHQYNWACMNAIAYSVPSVRSFAGRGHMLDSNTPCSEEGKLIVDLGERTKPFDT